MTERRVVITGIGGVTPMGNDWASSWEGLKAGKSGIAPIEGMDATDYACQIGGEVRGYDALPYFNNPKEGRRVDRLSLIHI